MASQELIQSRTECEYKIQRYGIDEERIRTLVYITKLAFEVEKDKAFGLETSARTKDYINKYIAKFRGQGKTVWDMEKIAQDNGIEEAVGVVSMYYELLKAESYDIFESFVYFMEQKRQQKKRFYLPRRKTMKIVVDDLQALEDSKSIKFFGLSMPSRVGKSTICIFFLAWIALKRPNSHSAMGGHSGVLAKGFYRELINIITTKEYTFKELYNYFHPEYADKQFPTDKSADEFTITLGDPDRFATITCRGIDGTWTGAIDVSADGYLYVDDLVRDRQHSLSPQRMEDTFQEYLNKMVDRKIGGAKELMVGTLWNVLDPLQRISIQYERDERYAFRRIPALNENDESNFDYEVNGFSTEYYRDMRERLANAEWMAKYQQSPYVREGLLFPQEELKYSDGLIDDGTWIVTALCDPAFGGADSLSMPVKLEHKESGKKTIIDWVFKKGTQNITIPLVVDAIIRNDITELKIEKNSGGGLYADNLKEKLRERGYNHCKITLFSASTKMDKMERIKAYSDYVKDNYYFLMESRYVPTVQEDEINGIKRFRRNEMYNNAMGELHMITSEGKNPHDDSADSITLMALNDEKPINRVEAIANPFRTGGYGYYGY